MSCFELLPYEVVLLIFKHISTRDLWRNVRLVSRYFASILDNDRLWISRIQYKYKIELPKLDFEQPLVRYCAEIEEELSLWGNDIRDRLGNAIRFSGHQATVDSILLLDTQAHRRICISGSRDHSLILWHAHPTGASEEEVKIEELAEAHQGWIWALCRSGSDSFCSCGWDRVVSRWMVTPDCVKQTTSMETTGAVLSVISEGDLTICSTFDKKVLVMDQRTSFKTVSEMLHHRCPVFSLADWNGTPYLYSCSQDHTIACVDKRTWKVVNQYTDCNSYGLSLSLEANQLLCGTSDGSISLFNPLNLSLLKKFQVSESNALVLQVKANLGSQLCIQRDRGLLAFTPGLKPSLLTEYTDIFGEPVRFDYYGGDLAVACGAGCVLLHAR